MTQEDFSDSVFLHSFLSPLEEGTGYVGRHLSRVFMLFSSVACWLEAHLTSFTHLRNLGKEGSTYRFAVDDPREGKLVMLLRAALVGGTGIRLCLSCEETVGPRANSTLPLGRPGAGMPEPSKETAGLLSVGFILSSASGVLTLCSPNAHPNPWDLWVSCTKYAPPWPVTGFTPRSLERMVVLNRKKGRQTDL